MARILIACEESQTVCKAFRALGHEAYSNDLIPTSGTHPEWHLQMDAFEAIKLMEWDLMIAHPPCTDLSVAGAAHWKKKQVNGTQQIAIDFFIKLFNSNINKIAIENPPGIMTKKFRPPDQYIEPYEHGEPYKKKTGLWLKNLPFLFPTLLIKPVSYWSQPHGSAYKNKSMTLNSTGGHRVQKIRSKTFPGIATAMAAQWGPLL